MSVTPEPTPQPTDNQPETPAAEPVAETPADDSSAPGAPDETDDNDDESDDADDPRDLAWYEGEVTRVRRQSKRYRTERNALQRDLDALTAARAAEPTPDPVSDAERRATAAESRLRRMELASEHGVPTKLLKDIDALMAADSDESVSAAMERITTHLAAAPQGRNPTPPVSPATPPSLDEQIKQAQASGDYHLAIKLKNQKLAS